MLVLGELCVFMARLSSSNDLSQVSRNHPYLIDLGFLSPNGCLGNCYSKARIKMFVVLGLRSIHDFSKIGN